MASQKRLAGPGAHVQVAADGPGTRRDDGGHERGDGDRSGRTTRVTTADPHHEQVTRVADGRQQTEDHAQGRVGTVGPLAARPGDQDDAQEHDRHGRDRGPRRPLPEDQERDDADDEDLEIAENGREARPDRFDGVVPEQQVAREEDAGDRGEPARPTGQATVPTLLGQGDEHEQRQPEQRAIHRTRGRRHRGIGVEDARERDADRPGEGREARPPRDPVEWSDPESGVRGRDGRGVRRRAQA